MASSKPCARDWRVRPWPRKRPPRRPPPRPRRPSPPPALDRGTNARLDAGVIIRPADFGLPPEEIFAALHRREGSFFLDSAQAAGGLGSHSFIGFEPFLTLR